MPRVSSPLAAATRKHGSFQPTMKGACLCGCLRSSVQDNRGGVMIFLLGMLLLPGRCCAKSPNVAAATAVFLYAVFNFRSQKCGSGGRETSGTWRGPRTIYSDSFSHQPTIILSTVRYYADRRRATKQEVFDWWRKCPRTTTTSGRKSAEEEVYCATTTNIGSDIKVSRLSLGDDAEDVHGARSRNRQCHAVSIRNASRTPTTWSICWCFHPLGIIGGVRERHTASS